MSGFRIANGTAQAVPTQARTIAGAKVDGGTPTNIWVTKEGTRAAGLGTYTEINAATGEGEYEFTTGETDTNGYLRLTLEFPDNSAIDFDDFYEVYSPISAADIQAECEDALVANHLDHLFANDYDPASKPGNATALMNELVENDAGVSRFTANSLENAPTGGGATWTSTQIEQVSHRLQLDGTQTVPSVEGAGNGTLVSVSSAIGDMQGATFDDAEDSLEAISTRVATPLTANPLKNAAFVFHAVLKDDSNNPITSAATVVMVHDAETTTTAFTGTVAHAHNGQYAVSALAADMDADVVTFFVTAGGVTEEYTFYPRAQ
jgi:hypothetical protein